MMKAFHNLLYVRENKLQNPLFHVFPFVLRYFKSVYSKLLQSLKIQNFEFIRNTRKGKIFMKINKNS